MYKKDVKMEIKLSEKLESNSVARKYLEDLFGKECFIEKLNCKSKYGEKLKKYTGKQQKEKMKELEKNREMTYHHIVTKEHKGVASIANGALLYRGNHDWFNNYCTASEQISMDKEFQEYKIGELKRDKYFKKILQLEDFKVPTYVHYSSRNLSTDERMEKSELINNFNLDASGKKITANGKKDLYWIFDGNEWKLHLEEEDEAGNKVIKREENGKIEIVKIQPKELSEEESKEKWLSERGLAEREGRLEETKEEKEKRLEKRKKDLESKIKEKEGRKINAKKIREIEDKLSGRDDIQEIPLTNLEMLVKGESFNYKGFEEINNDNENGENDKIVEDEAITTNSENKENKENNEIRKYEGNERIKKYKENGKNKENSEIKKIIRDKKVNKGKENKGAKTSLVIKKLINKILNKIDNINKKESKVVKQKNEVLHNTEAQNTWEEKRENLMDRLKIPQEDLKQLKDSQQLNELKLSKEFQQLDELQQLKDLDELQQSKELRYQEEQEINDEKPYRAINLGAISQNDPEMLEEYMEMLDADEEIYDEEIDDDLWER